ncbi:hypothetical protein Tco_1143613 [Tanacetum coccineum]
MTFSKVPDTKDTIKFKLYTQEITYTIDMFHDTLKLPVETPNNPFIAPVNIKDDISLVSVYSTGNGLFQGMPISDAFLTDEIRATDDYVEYKTVFVKVSILINQPQPVVSSQGTHRTTPRAYKTPTLTAASPQGKKRKQIAEETSSARKLLKVTIKQKVNTTSIPPPSDGRERDEIAEATLLIQEKLVEEEIEKMVKGEGDEESYASEFDDYMLHDDVEDSSTRIDPGSHKENPEVFDDDDVTQKKDDKKDEDEEKDDDVKKNDDATKEKDNDDHTDHTLVRTHATGIKKGQEITPTYVPELISKEFATNAPKMIEELFQKHMWHTTLNLYPTTTYKEVMEWSDGDVVPTSVPVVKSSREERNVGKSNIGDSDNTGDGGKIVGGAIRACDGIGERASEAKRSLVKSSKKLEEVFPGDAGK